MGVVTDLYKVVKVKSDNTWKHINASSYFYYEISQFLVIFQITFQKDYVNLYISTICMYAYVILKHLHYCD